MQQIPLAALKIKKTGERYYFSKKLFNYSLLHKIPPAKCSLVDFLDEPVDFSCKITQIFKFIFDNRFVKGHMYLPSNVFPGIYDKYF